MKTVRKIVRVYTKQKQPKQGYDFNKEVNLKIQDFCEKHFVIEFEAKLQDDDCYFTIYGVLDYKPDVKEKVNE